MEICSSFLFSRRIVLETGILLGLVVGTLVLVEGCGSAAQGDKAVLEVLRRRKMVDLSKLTSDEVQLLVNLVRREASPCEGSLSLLEELRKAEPCRDAIRAVGFFYRRILDGYPESDILDQFVARFKKGLPVSIEVTGRPDTGPEGARVTIVVFSDFECSFCKKAAATIGKIKKERADHVRVIYKHLPLVAIHHRAMKAALAAEAALLQGRFWEMHDALFELEGDLDDEKLEEAAGKAGLDITRWKEDLQSPEVMERVNKDKEEAVRLHIRGTPTIFVNGIEFQEYLKYLPQYVEELLL